MGDTGEQCRWRLECHRAARHRITVDSLGFVVPACDTDARYHTDWERRAADRAERGMQTLTPDPEPEPDCYCPDVARRWSAERRRREVPYCPTHGTPEERGLDVVGEGEW